MRSYLFFLMFTLPFHLSFAALKSAGKTHLNIDYAKKTASLTIDQGFHFNLEAPKYLLNEKTKQPPASATENHLEFKWTKELSENSQLTYYVCDEAKTVCEPHTDKLGALIRKNAGGTSKKQNQEQQKRDSSATSNIKKDAEGFILNDLDVAKKEAAKKNSLILIDFTASWCPACIRLIHETFSDRKFKKAAKDFVLLKIDVDLDENQELLEKYSIHAFPSMVIIDSNEKEFDRILDFTPAETLAPTLEILAKKRPKTIEQLKGEAQAGNLDARLILGKNAFKAQQTDACLDWLRPLKNKPIEYYFCLIEHSEENASDKKLKTNNDLEIALNDAINNYSESFYAIDWRIQLSEFYKKNSQPAEAEKVLSDAQKMTLIWLENPHKMATANHNGELFELKGLVAPELHFSLGRIFEGLGKKEASRKEFQAAVELVKATKPSTENPTIILYLVQYLKKSEQTDSALEWLKKLELAYPQEFTYLHRQASLLTETKKFNEALPVAERAYSMSYGNNRIKTGLLLAKIQAELNNKKEAKSVLEELLNSSTVQAKGNKRGLEKIQRALAEIKM